MHNKKGYTQAKTRQTPSTELQFNPDYQHLLPHDYFNKYIWPCDLVGSCLGFVSLCLHYQRLLLIGKGTCGGGWDLCFSVNLCMHYTPRVTL